jgi:DNA-directed RNA polymerase specialized sigma24 family protein
MHAFQTTRWSLVLMAGAEAETGALETLCRRSWYPLYGFIRRSGRGEEDAKDLTQEFFARLLEKQWLQDADPHRGKFRTFLLMALKRFLANEWDRTQCLKRGGGSVVVPLDATEAESRYQHEALQALDDHLMFDRRWALTLLEQSLERLEGEWGERAAEFQVLKGCLTAERGRFDCDEAAAKLGSNEGAVRVAVHRLRKRFREVFREEIAQTIADPADVDEEVRHLVDVLAQG